MGSRVATPAELLGPLNEVEAKNAPAKLFLEGDPRLLCAGRRVSLVGARDVTSEGLSRTARLAEILVQQGVVVVSGLARGVDTAAHRRAIDAGGRTVTVLGTPLDQCSPAANRDLLDEIKRDHLAVSEFEIGTSPGRRAFPMRNRTMALVSDATVIVEAGASSGTLHQGWEALRLGRPLFLLKSLVERPGLSWPAEMLGYGAQVLSDDTIDLLFEMLPEPRASFGVELGF